MKQILCRTEIEGNYVKTNSRAIIVVWQSWIGDPASFVSEIPDFSFNIAENQLSKTNHEKSYLLSEDQPPMTITSSPSGIDPCQKRPFANDPI